MAVHIRIQMVNSFVASKKMSESGGLCSLCSTVFKLSAHNCAVATNQQR